MFARCVCEFGAAGHRGRAEDSYLGYFRFSAGDRDY